MNPQEYEDWQKTIIRECLRVLKPTGSIFYNHKDLLAGGVIIPPKWVYDFDVHQQIVWDRSASPQQNNRYFTPITEYIYWIVKDKKEFFFDKSKRVFKHAIWRMNPDKKPHPAPFPLIMAENIVNCCSREADLMYDPFMGSGTTGIVANKLGRHYVGIELNPEYVEMAERRIKLEESQLKLF